MEMCTIYRMSGGVPSRKDLSLPSDLGTGDQKLQTSTADGP